MRKLAFIFPGQGSQKVGMGLELSRTYAVAREAFEEADTILGRKLSQLCFDGPDETLKQTENTQLAMLTCGVATLRVLIALEISPHVVAGHSLGEYTALVAAGVLTFSDALKLVAYRARFMAEASRKQAGTMAAVLGLDEKTLQALCEAARPTGVVEIANYNCPGQLIISGELSAIEQVMESAKTAGAKRCLPLRVSGAFHSSLMAPAKASLGSVIGNFPFNTPQKHVVANVTGDFVSSADEIRRLLIEQVTSPVQWEKSIRTVGATGVSHFVEVGPGKALSGMVRRILPQATPLHVEEIESLEETIGIIRQAT